MSFDVSVTVGAVVVRVGCCRGAHEAIGYLAPDEARAVAEELRAGADSIEREEEEATVGS